MTVVSDPRAIFSFEVPAIDAVQLPISLTVSDVKGAPVEVSLEFAATAAATGVVGGFAPGAASVNGQPLPVVVTETAGEGTVLTVVWEILGDLGAAASTDVQVRFAVTDTVTQTSFTTQAGTIPRYGNDPPVVTNIQLSGTRENVIVSFDLSDTTADIAGIESTTLGLRPEYTADGGATFSPIPAEAVVGGATTNLVSGLAPAVASANFTWNTTETVGGTQQLDLVTADVAVFIRLTPLDSQSGTAVQGGPFSIGNNSPPLVFLSDANALSADNSREVALELSLVDVESDPIDLQIQFSDSATFPPLSPAEQAQTVQAKRIDVEGHVELPQAAPPADELFVPGFLARFQAHPVLGHPLLGKTIEVLEAAGSSSLVAPLGSPRGILIEPGDGFALVADAGAGSVVRVDLTTETTTDLATGLSAPNQLALEPGEASVLLTTASRLVRVDRTSGAVTELATGLVSPQGVVALSDSEALVLEDDGTGRLVHVDLALAATPARNNVRVLLSGFSSPRGLALDRPHRVVFVAERGPAPAGTTPAEERITRVALEGPVRTQVISAANGGPSAPSSLHLAGNGRSLVVATEEGAASRLIELNRNNATLGGPTLLDGLNAPAGLAARSDDSALFVTEATPELTRLSLGTAVLQTATTTAIPTSSTLAVTPAFSPAVAPGSRFRILGAASEGLTGLSSSPGGIAHRIVLDMRPVLGTPAEGITFKVTPSDAKEGTPNQTGKARSFAVGGIFDPKIEIDVPVGTALAEASKSTNTLAGDLDGDGDLDFLRLFDDSDEVHILLQDSPAPSTQIRFNDTEDIAGVFTTTLILTDGAEMDNPQYAALGDLDGDGDLDFVTANLDSNNLSVFFQTAPGTFGTPPTRLADGTDMAEPRAVAVADLDGDGDLDIVSANKLSANLSIFFQTSTPGVFGSPPTQLADPTGVGPVHVVVGDLDRDGDIDIASANEDSGEVSVFFQESAGVFSTTATVLTDPAAFGPLKLALGDLDGDGDLDIVAASEEPGNGANDVLSVFFQTTPGVFSAATSLPSGPFLRDVKVGDMDSDGDADIMPSGAAFYFQTSPGNFEKGADRAGIDTETTVHVADLDGNGLLDLIPAKSSTRVHFQDSPRLFSPLESLANVKGIEFPVEVDVVDIDGDGDNDLVVANGDAILWGIMLQTAPGVFEAGFIIFSDSRGHTNTIAKDIDGDGKLDLLSAFALVGTVGALLPEKTPHVLSAHFATDDPAAFAGQGPIAYDAVHITDPDMIWPIDVACEDLDGDGDLDIVTANGLFNYKVDKLVGELVNFDPPPAPSNNLTIYFQTAPRVFSSPATVLTSAFMTSPGAVAAADLDGDGDNDIVTANVDSDNLTIFFQTAPGVFGGVTVLADGTNTDGCAAVRVGDLDGDGDNDIVSNNVDASSLTMFFQTSPGVFGPATVFPGSGAARPAGVDGNPTRWVSFCRMDIGDLDGDGDNDVAAANLENNNVTILYQTTPGVFASKVVIAVDRPTFARIVDLNGDGVLDLLTNTVGGGSDGPLPDTPVPAGESTGTLRWTFR